MWATKRQGTDIMNTSSRAFARKATSCITASVLACTLAPAAGLAYADTAESSAAEAALAEAADDAATTEAAPAASKVTVVDVPESVDVVSGSVQLDGVDAAPVLVSADGLTYLVLDDAAATAALVGWSPSAAPEGALVVPSEISVSDRTFAITEIWMGGVH